MAGLNESEWILAMFENFTANVLIPDSSDFLMDHLPSVVKYTLCVIYSILIVGSFSTNVCVLFVILCHRSLRNITNTFIVSLSISNILVATWTMPLQFVYHLQNEWTFGEAMCKVTSYVQGVSIVSSILALVAISVERYRAICFPMLTRVIRTTRSAVCVVGLLWTTALIVLLPQLWIQQQQQRLSWQPETSPPIRIAYVCVEYFPQHVYNICYTIGFFFLLYILPVIVTGYAYGRMAQVLWIRTHIGEPLCQSQIANKREKQKRNIIRMLMLIVLCYILCWLPFFAMHVYVLFCEFSQTVRILQAFALLFGYSNSFINALIYFFLNAKFKRIFRKRLRGILKEGSKPSDSPVQLSHSTCTSM